jgi:hypothetical protein
MLKPTMEHKFTSFGKQLRILCPAYLTIIANKTFQLKIHVKVKYNSYTAKIS